MSLTCAMSSSITVAGCAAVPRLERSGGLPPGSRSQRPVWARSQRIRPMSPRGRQNVGDNDADYRQHRPGGLMTTPFGRVLTAMITPFDSQGAVDHGTTWDLANHLIDTGSEGIVVGGTTGESPTLSTDEKVALFRAVAEAVGKRRSEKRR